MCIRDRSRSTPSSAGWVARWPRCSRSTGRRSSTGSGSRMWTSSRERTTPCSTSTASLRPAWPSRCARSWAPAEPLGAPPPSARGAARRARGPLGLGRRVLPRVDQARADVVEVVAQRGHHELGVALAYGVQYRRMAVGRPLCIGPRRHERDVRPRERLQRAPDSLEGAVADVRFHGRVIEMAGNGTLERVWRSLEPFSRTYITLVAPGADAQWTADRHAPVLDAIRQRDPELMVAALRHHFDDISARLVDAWQDPPAEPERTPGAPRRAAR